MFFIKKEKDITIVQRKQFILPIILFVISLFFLYITIDFYNGGENFWIPAGACIFFLIFFVLTKGYGVNEIVFDFVQKKIKANLKIPLDFYFDNL